MIARSNKKYLGYFIFSIVSILVLGLISKISPTPWLNFLAPVLALLSSLKFINHMSLKVVVGIIMLLTTFAPIGLLIAIGADSHEALINYVNVKFIVQIALPTFVTIISYLYIKKHMRTTGEM